MNNRIYMVKVRFIEGEKSGGTEDVLDFDFAFQLHPTKEDVLAAIEKKLEDTEHERGKDSGTAYMDMLLRMAWDVVNNHIGSWWSVGVCGGRPSTYHRGYIQLEDQVVFDNNAAIG